LDWRTRVPELEKSGFPASRGGFEAASGYKREIPAGHGRYWTNRTEETEEREVSETKRERESVKVQPVKDEKNKKNERKNKKASERLRRHFQSPTKALQKLK
jgi:hypothetical protein